MGEYAEMVLEREIFGEDDLFRQYRKRKRKKKTPFIGKCPLCDKPLRAMHGDYEASLKMHVKAKHGGKVVL